jgi:hypothetical protein
VTLHATDWTGSSAQRRPQGTCSPPVPVETRCEWLPIGTPVTCRPKRGTSRQWRTHTTRIELRITETIKRTHNSVTFAHDDWVISVSLMHVMTYKR